MVSMGFSLNTSSIDKHEPLTKIEERDAHRTGDAIGHSPHFAKFSCQAQAQLETANAIERHMRWLRNQEVRPWNKRGIWFPSSFYSEGAIKNIEWGRVAGAISRPIVLDASASKAFSSALELQGKRRD